MKSLVTMLLALGLAAPLDTPVFAQDMPTDEASCTDAGMQWDADMGECKPAE